MSESFLAVLAVVFLAPLVVGLITFLRQWSDDLLHLFLSFGAGIFLGVVFIHLLPEAFPGNGEPARPISILLGFLLIFFVERFLLARDGDASGHRHRVVSFTVLIGLSAHSVIEGFGMAVGATESRLATLFFVSIIAHKLPAAVALVSLLSLAKLTRRKIFGYLLLFSAMTPVGALALAPFSNGGEGLLVTELTGVVTGSFLYVATGDLLPEVFHSRRHRWLHLVLLLLGIVAMYLLGMLLPEAH